MDPEKLKKSPFGSMILPQFQRDAMLARMMEELLYIHTKFIEKVNQLDDIIKKKVGPKGNDGATPTKEELSVLIQALLPTESEIVATIKSLIPEVRDGEDGENGITPDEEYLKALIYSMMPKMSDLSSEIKKNFPKYDIEEIATKAAKKVKPSTVTKVEKLDPQDLVDYIVENKKLGVKDITGMDKFILELRAEFRRSGGGKMRGGGDTVAAGSGVNINVVDGKKVISVPGAPGTPVYEENITGSGTGPFALAHTPIAGTLRLYRGGARQQIGIDYTLAAANITLTIAKASDEILLADYNY